MTERWAFTKSELADPTECNAHDDLQASVTVGPDEKVGVIVYRNGKASNRFSDGVAGIGKDLAELAEAEETLYDPDTAEIADNWRDVVTDDTGAWLGWANE